MIDFTPPAELYEELVANKNAILTFNLKTGAFTTDSSTGNKIPETSNVAIQCIVHSTRRPDDAVGQFFQGKEQRSQWFKGRMLMPQFAPAGINHLSRGKMKLGTFDNCDNFSETSKGDFILYNPHLNPYTKGSLGTKFFGVFLSE